MSRRQPRGLLCLCVAGMACVTTWCGMAPTNVKHWEVRGAVGTGGSTVNAIYDLDKGRKLQMHGSQAGGEVTEVGGRYQFPVGAGGPQVKVGTSYSPNAEEKKIRFSADVDHKVSEAMTVPGMKKGLTPGVGATLTESNAALRASVTQPLSQDLNVGVSLAMAKDHAEGAPISNVATAETSLRVGGGTLVGNVVSRDQ
eukprot:CAMPEP_0194490656 /NCGR_PEP_ID=MMETSP0253-20130528/9802_1 /TAXON_ID=2966 /ORGANISM="Noctiluca scintillans" /LENGTH=197 /DNA_ID=CAMNT_0039331309 /DNA_START=96 /DNA_END=686 /DNA_ORIENTATION=-